MGVARLYDRTESATLAELRFDNVLRNVRQGCLGQRSA